MIKGAGFSWIDGSSLDPAEYGHKAANLALLKSAGYLVPSGVAIPLDAVGAFGPTEAEALLAQFDDGQQTLIVRSSGIAEDSAEFSYAGHFESIRCRPQVQGLLEAVGRVHRSGADGETCAVIVQAWIDADYAGVAFSCDPITFAREPVVNWTAGTAEALVGGAAEGSTWRSSEERALPPEVPEEPWQALLLSLKQLERATSAPVDVEWCVKGVALYHVQVRPVVLPPAGDYPLDTPDAGNRVPHPLRNHRKLRLRQAALEAGVPMARAVLHIATHANDAAVRETSLDAESAATTIVLVHPDTIAGKIVREFSGSSAGDVESLVTACKRYAIRRYPAFVDVGEAVKATLARGLEVSAVAAVVEGQILRATWTGVFSKTAAGSLFEIAQGHFVPKGLVQTSSYRFDASGSLVDMAIVDQDEVIHFIDGRVVHESPVEQQRHPTRAEAETIAAALERHARAFPGSAVEFGVLTAKDGGEPDVFVIDLVDVQAGAIPGPGTSRDAVSVGAITGRPVVVDSEGEAHDVHFHNVVGDSEGAGAGEDPVVYLAVADTLSLLPLLHARPAHTMGFVFRRASLLSHLSIVLREMGIPAGVHAWDTAIESARSVGLDVTAGGVEVRIS